MLTTVRRSRPKGPLRAVPGATNNRKIGGRLCYCDITPPLESSVRPASKTHTSVAALSPYRRDSVRR